MNTELLDVNQTTNEVVDNVVTTDVSTNVVGTHANGGIFKTVAKNAVWVLVGIGVKTGFDKGRKFFKAKKATKVAAKNATETTEESK